MVEVDILYVVQDGSVINVATVQISICEAHLKDGIEMLAVRLQNASQVLKKMLKDAEAGPTEMIACSIAGFLLAKEEPLLHLIMSIFVDAKQSDQKISCLLLQWDGESTRVGIEIPDNLRALRV